MIASFPFYDEFLLSLFQSCHLCNLPPVSEIWSLIREQIYCSSLFVASSFPSELLISFSRFALRFKTAKCKIHQAINSL